MKRIVLRTATLTVLAILPLALGGCIVVEHGHRGGYCYYHRC